MLKKVNAGAALVLAVAAYALLAVAATAGVGVQNTNSNNSSGGGNANHSSTKMTSDVKFADEAAMGGMAEVQLGQLAAQKGASDEVRQFGQKMVDDHSKANDDLKQVAANKGLTLPTSLSAKQQAEMQKLNGLSGDKFDKEYVGYMLNDHKEDAKEFQKESTGGSDPDIKGFAARTLPVIQGHLQMIQRIHDKMALRKSGNLSNSNASGGDNMGSNMNMSGNSNSNKGKGKNKNSNGNSNSNNSNM